MKGLIKRGCNNCGRCCHNTPCDPALTYVNGAKEGQPCPALMRHGERYFCGLWLAAESFIDLAWSDNLGDKAAEARLVYIREIHTWLRRTFVDECDSHYGQGVEDRRIAIHLL